ncbi:LLM class flavin-dependent oxidoreductase [Kitasatospora sp. NE20-6]|uniref:LLM class flavin-dependent oxidoreductase n=1 Tax=Kitasatospora sp. NE20-6 TaxID=2859066 RepID=UPI0038B23E13
MATADNIFAITDLAERLGYESLWGFQPFRKPHRTLPDGLRRHAYDSRLEPMTLLAAVAGRTSRARLGIVVSPGHSLVELANRLATLDLLSSGRLDLGIGPGWSGDRFSLFGQRFGERGRATDELLAKLRSALAGEPAEDREHDLRIPRPMPVQKPTVPILLVGYGKATVQRIVAYGDGCVAGQLSFERWGRLVADVCRQVAAAGRDASALRFVCRATVRLHRRPLVRRRLMEGSTGQIRTDLARYAAVGVTDLSMEFDFEETANRHGAAPGTVRTSAEHILYELAPQQGTDSAKAARPGRRCLTIASRTEPSVRST